MSWLTAREVAQMQADAESLMPDTCTILSVAYTSDGEGGMTEAWGTATASVKCLDSSQAGDDGWRRGNLHEGDLEPALTRCCHDQSRQGYATQRRQECQRRQS